MEQNILTYKGQPLARCGNKIYYGDPSQKAILVLTILESKTQNGDDVPSRVLIQIQSTDPALDIFISLNIILFYQPYLLKYIYT